MVEMVNVDEIEAGSQRRNRAQLRIAEKHMILLVTMKAGMLEMLVAMGEIRWVVDNVNTKNRMIISWAVVKLAGRGTQRPNTRAYVMISRTLTQW